VVHRFLAVLSAEMQRGRSADRLLEDLAGWQPRVAASLRGEGVAGGLAEREAARALKALRMTLEDQTGRWILGPHPGAATERAMTTAERTLRADRTFLAGAEPLSEGERHIWIVDFKTTERGSRSLESFREVELGKYREQLESYARVRREVEAASGLGEIRLGLFYPFLPELLEWPSGSAEGAEARR
jgi:hypothetical protein